MTITEFLEARITEDEVAATLRECHREDCGWIPDEAGYSYPCNCGVPERMAAECKAKRAISKQHEIDLHSSEPYCDTCAEWWACELGEGPPPVKYPCPTIRIITAVYAGHPDYRQEWALNG